MPVECFLDRKTIVWPDTGEEVEVLGPHTPDDENKVRKLPTDKPVRAQITVPRNLAMHRRGFAFLQAVFSLQDQFEDFEVFRKWLVMKAGYFDVMVIPDRSVGGRRFESGEILLPKSLSFASMDEVEFRECVQRMITAFLNSICNHGLTVHDIDQAWNEAMSWT